MKKIFLFLLILLGSSNTLFAGEVTITSSSQVPSGATTIVPGVRWQVGSDYYNLSPSSNTTSSSNVTNTSNATSILGNGEDEETFFTKLRTGNITFEDIPKIIVNAIEFILGIAGAISIVVIIYGALQMQLSSGILGKSDDKGKKIIIAGIIGFVISISSWFIMTKFVEILVSSVG